MDSFFFGGIGLEIVYLKESFGDFSHGTDDKSSETFVSIFYRKGNRSNTV